jgi:hypothetical protein
MQRKLDNSAVQAIRQLYETGEYKQQYLALIYGVSSPQISRIVNLKRRKCATSRHSGKSGMGDIRN